MQVYYQYHHQIDTDHYVVSWEFLQDPYSIASGNYPLIVDHISQHTPSASDLQALHMMSTFPMDVEIMVEVMPRHSNLDWSLAVDSCIGPCKDSEL